MQINRTYSSPLANQGKNPPHGGCLLPPPTIIKRTPRKELLTRVIGLLEPASILWGALCTNTRILALLINLHFHLSLSVSCSILCPRHKDLNPLITMFPQTAIFTLQHSFLHFMILVVPFLLYVSVNKIRA